MFQSFISHLEIALKQSLPGKPAQALLKPYLKINKNIDAPLPLVTPKKGAVMALIYPKYDVPHILFIERPVYDGVHSGQIAFPGGKIEKEDATVVAAALRETFEEVGILQKDIKVLGALSEVYVFASNFMVFPFVGVIDNLSTLKLQETEVAGILEIPLSIFFEDNIIKEKPIKNAFGFTLMAPYYDLSGKTLWGATAMMVSELCTIIKDNNIRIN